RGTPSVTLAARATFDRIATPRGARHLAPSTGAAPRQRFWRGAAFVTFRFSGVRQRNTHRDDVFGRTPAFARRDPVEAAHRPKQGRARVEADLFDDLLHGKLAAAQQSSRNTRALALQVFVRRHVMDVLEQAQEMM